MDELQGSNRMERSTNFMESLQYVWAEPSHCHKRAIVDGVGHDHSYMFNSPEGMKTVFDIQIDHDCSASQRESSYDEEILSLLQDH